jgi:hypothetical protein
MTGDLTVRRLIRPGVLASLPVPAAQARDGREARSLTKIPIRNLSYQVRQKGPRLSAEGPLTW